MDRLLRTGCCLAMCMALAAEAPAQETSRHETLRSQDGVSIHITYYPFVVNQKDASGAKAENAPVVVLLPGEGESRLFWDKNSAPRELGSGKPPLPFPALLQSYGYAAVTVDLRKHGDSVVQGSESVASPNDYEAMVLGDMVAVNQFLFEEHQAKRLNVNKLGVVAVGKSSAVAAGFAEWSWKQIPYDDAPVEENRTPRGHDVRALVFLSPERVAGRLNVNQSLTFLRNPKLEIALQVIVGAVDPLDKRQAKQIYDSFEAANKGAARLEFFAPQLKERGIALMTNQDVYVSVLKFLDTQLKKVNSPWQDRRSRFER